MNAVIVRVNVKDNSTSRTTLVGSFQRRDQLQDAEKKVLRSYASYEFDAEQNLWLANGKDGQQFRIWAEFGSEAPECRGNASSA
jgi:hypothetical protein